MKTVKVIVTGPAGSGKTQFVRTLSKMEVISTTRRTLSDPPKGAETVTIDFGRIAMAQDLVVHLFGIPGQERFDFMWEIISKGPLGLLVLVDSTRTETFREALRLVDLFTARRECPYAIVANKQDLENAWPPAELRLALRLPDDIEVLPCVATKPERAKEVLVKVLSMVVQLTEEG